MAATSKTSHYNLVKYNPNDLTTWDDFNGNMDKIDNVMSDLDERIEEIINSPDVRYIVATYAELESISKSSVGDKDFARVLQDETRNGDSTYYQFDKDEQDWDYVGGISHEEELSVDEFKTIWEKS